MIDFNILHNVNIKYIKLIFVELCRMFIMYNLLLFITFAWVFTDRAIRFPNLSFNLPQTCLKQHLH